LLTSFLNVSKELFTNNNNNNNSNNNNNNNNNNNSVQQSISQNDHNQSKENQIVVPHVWQDDLKCFSSPISLFKFPGDSVKPDCIISETRVCYARQWGATSPLYIYDFEQQSFIIKGMVIFWNDELKRPDLANQPDLKDNRPRLTLTIIDSFRFIVHLSFKKLGVEIGMNLRCLFFFFDKQTQKQPRNRKTENLIFIGNSERSKIGCGC